MKVKARHFRLSQLSTLNTQLSTGLHLLPAFTPESVRGLAQWEVVSSYSSATAPDSHGISCAGPLFSSSQRTGSRSSGLRFVFQDLFNQSQINFFSCPRLILL